MPSDYIFLGKIFSLLLGRSGKKVFLICILCQLSLQLSGSLLCELVHILLADFPVMLSSAQIAFHFRSQLSYFLYSVRQKE